MEITPRRALIDVFFIWLFASFWRSTIRWMVLAVAMVFVWGIVRSAAADFRAHGVGADVPLNEVALSASVDSGFADWTVTNHTDKVVGSVEITCTDGEWTYIGAPDGYIAPGQSLSGTFRSTDISYAATCSVTRAFGYRR